MTSSLAGFTTGICAMSRAARYPGLMIGCLPISASSVAVSTISPAVIDRDGIGRLRRESEGDIVIYGSLSLVSGLSRLGLIDEYHLLVHPVALAVGKPMFDSPARLKLKSSEQFQSGVMLLKYESMLRATDLG